METMGFDAEDKGLRRRAKGSSYSTIHHDPLLRKSACEIANQPQLGPEQTFAGRRTPVYLASAAWAREEFSCANRTKRRHVVSGFHGRGATTDPGGGVCARLVAHFRNGRIAIGIVNPPTGAGV